MSYTDLPSNATRSRVQDYIPSTAKDDSLFVVTHGVELTASANVVNNGMVVFIYTLTQDVGDGTAGLVRPRVNLYIGTIDPNNMIPGGASVNTGLYFIYGPVNTPWSAAGVAAKPNEYMHRVGVRNSSGSSQTIIRTIQYLQVANRGNQSVAPGATS